MTALGDVNWSEAAGDGAGTVAGGAAAGSGGYATMNERAAPVADVRVYGVLDAPSTAAADATAQLAVTAVAERGCFLLVLSGGSTPRRLYELLAAASPERIPWARV